jgi:hypothetical protein
MNEYETPCGTWAKFCKKGVVDKCTCLCLSWSAYAAEVEHLRNDEIDVSKQLSALPLCNQVRFGSHCCSAQQWFRVERNVIRPRCQNHIGALPVDRCDAWKIHTFCQNIASRPENASWAMLVGTRSGREHSLTREHSRSTIIIPAVTVPVSCCCQGAWLSKNVTKAHLNTRCITVTAKRDLAALLNTVT